MAELACDQDPTCARKRQAHDYCSWTSPARSRLSRERQWESAWQSRKRWRGQERRSCSPTANRKPANRLRRMIGTAERFGGGIDILVNNAGGVDAPVYPDAPPERWQRVLDVNLRAVMLATQLALQALRRRGGGAIVNVASVAGLGAGPHGAPEYAAAKAGVVRLTAALSLLAEEGIRVNAICPDYVDTPAMQKSLSEIDERERVSLPELVSPQAIAGGVLDLIRDDSLAGRVLVWFADEPPYLLPPDVPR